MMRAAFGGGPGAPLRLLCLGAHADDIEIGCGGTVLRLLAERPGSSVRWVVCSSDPLREREARASAAAFLGEAAEREVVVKSFRESYFPAMLSEIKEFFESLKSGPGPDLVLTPRRRDEHQDHRTIAELTWNTFRDHVILEYEIPKFEGDLGHPNVYVPLPEAVARRKVESVMLYFASQRGRAWFRAETFESVMRLRAIECNAPEGFAEGLYARKLVV
jgi:LmbE family N-acetylglucosaminyl deacetylase